MFVTGIVLAAGASRRLGTPKQLLSYRGAPLLDATLRTARACHFEQLLVTLGGAAEQVLERVDLAGTSVVLNEDYGTGCGGSIRAAVEQVNPRAEGLVLLLGDQVGVSADSVRALLAAVLDPTPATEDRDSTAATADIGVCHYRDGLGHPFFFSRAMFGELSQLHGDKAVWKLLHSGRFEVVECALEATVPPDVDTWADYNALVGQS